jgi:uncharacterized membrane protein
MPPSPVSKKSDLYDSLFRIGMVWRIIYGALRLALGLGLLRVIGTPLSDLFYSLMGHEIIEDPGDALTQLLASILQHQSFTVTYFLASYLIFWGVIDIVLSFSLLKERLWAFPISIYLIGIFLLYEMYRYTHTHSLVLLGVIGIDIALIWLIRKEYKKLSS